MAIHEVNGFYELGVIDEIDRDHRVSLLEIARTMAEIEQSLADLRAGRPGERATRVADDDRNAALRRLALHHAEGELEKDEYDRRVTIVQSAHTQGEIEDAFAELTGLHARRQRRSERLTSTPERNVALKRLAAAYGDGQLLDDEYERRCGIVRAARTRGELEPAFNGLEPVRARKQIKAAKDLGTGIVRGGQAILTGTVLLGWASASAFVLIVWLILHIGAIIPIILLALIALFALSLLVLVR